jgi:uncharacterized membrane protein YvbJ
MARLDNPSKLKGLKKNMKNKYITYIAAIIVIAIIVSGAFIYFNNAASNPSNT